MLALRGCEHFVFGLRPFLINATNIVQDLIIVLYSPITTYNTNRTNTQTHKHQSSFNIIDYFTPSESSFPDIELRKFRIRNFVPKIICRGGAALSTIRSFDYNWQVVGIAGYSSIVLR